MPRAVTSARANQYPDEISGLLQEYMGRTLLDSKITDIDAILLVIYIREWRNESPGVEQETCKEMFIEFGRKIEPNFRVNLGNAIKKGLIENKSTTLYLLIDGLRRVQRIFGSVQKEPVLVIKSGQNFTAIKLLEDFFAHEIGKGELAICDSYMSANTLFPLSTLGKKAQSIRLLTANIQDKAKFIAYKTKLEKEIYAKISVRTNSKIHDRYIINGDKCWFLGASIKDLGNKDTIIREISDVCTTFKELFEERWSEGTPFN